MLISEDEQPKTTTSALNPLVLACFERWEPELERLDAPQSVAALLVLCDVGPMQLGDPRLVQLAMLWAWSKRQPLHIGVLQGDPSIIWEPDAHGFNALSRARSARLATLDDLERWRAHLAHTIEPAQLIILSPQALDEVPWRYHIQQPARQAQPLPVALWQGDSLVDRVLLEPPLPQEALSAFGQLYLRHPLASDADALQGAPRLQSARFGGRGERIIGVTAQGRLGVCATPRSQAQPKAASLLSLTSSSDERPIALGWLGQAPLTLTLDTQRQLLSLWRGDARWLTLSDDLPELERLDTPADAPLPKLVVGRGYHAHQGKRWAALYPDGSLLHGACAQGAPARLAPTPVRAITKLLGQLWQLNEHDHVPSKPKEALDATLLERFEELVLDHTGASPDQLRALVPARHDKPSAQPALHLPLPVLRMSAPRVAAMLVDRDGQPKLAAQINERWCWSGSLVVAHWQDRFLFELPPRLHVIGVMPSARCAEELGFIALDEPTRTHLWFAGRRFERLLWRAPERIRAVCLDTTGRRVLLTGASGQRWLISSHLGALLWTGPQIL